MLRRRFYKLHRWLGLVTGAILLVVSISGVPLLFRQQLDRATRPAAYRISGGRTEVSKNVLVARALERYPGSRAVALELDGHEDGLEGGLESGQVEEPVPLALRDESGSLTVFLDPYRGTVLGDSRAHPSISATIYKLHTSLFLGRVGSIVTTLLGVCLVGMALTGIYVYRAAWRNPFRLPWRRGRRYPFRAANLHRVTGVWALLFLAMSGATGFWLNHESLLPEAREDKAATFPVERMRDLGGLVGSAESALPGFHAVSLVFAEDGSDTLSIYGWRRENGLSFLFGLYASEVQLSGQSDRILKTSTPAEQSFAERLNNLIYPVHSADFSPGPLLLAARCVYALAGLAPGVLFVSGFVLTRQRRRSVSRPGVVVS